MFKKQKLEVIGDVLWMWFLEKGKTELQSIDPYVPCITRLSCECIFLRFSCNKNFKVCRFFNDSLFFN